jgi:hypothetical protein
MTTPCSHRHPHEHTHAPTGRWLKRLTEVCGPARSAPSPPVTVRRWHRQGKRVTAVVHDTPPAAELLDRAGRREVPLLETLRLDLLLRSRAA